MTDATDCEQYVYYTLLVNPDFDQRPEGQRIVGETQGRPAAFGAAMEALPDSVVQEIKSNRFGRVIAGAGP
ncbi:hypothetical protein [Paraburkholderia sp.]|uniref:hypothetical protein n=1 Tax=Paraburkholderia sp. TaxID=1926495 RepID=UPI0025E4DE1B|nr:hypothetical protein [Paraburkholderia sp.]